MIKKLMTARRFIAAGMLTAFMFVGIASVNAQLTEGLVAHWPLDEINGETTPDVVSGYDMNVDNMTADNVVEGIYGNAISFSNADQTLLWRKNEEGDALPANKNDSFTISFWSQLDGNGQSDLRVFSESNTEGNNTPLFNIGTKNNGSDGTIDIYIRGAGPTVGHIFSTAEPFDGDWHHVVFVQEDLERSIYVDGVLDDLEIAAKPESGWDDINATTIGGILRGNASHWVTGVIDDVAIWDRALSADEVGSLNSGGIPAQNAPLASFLIDFGGAAANSAGASPDPWITFDNLVMDETVDLGGGATLTALDDGFNPNNPAQPGEGAEYDGVVVPQEARNDYFFKIADTAGTTARMRFDGLPAGSYKVTVFEGRTTDDNQVAKIWTGEEPEEENTGNFAQGSATVEVNVGAGEPLWYMHLEDNTGGVSGLIIRQTSSGTPERSVTWDFNGGLPDGSEVAGSAEHSEDEGVDDSGALVITRAENSQLGGWLSEDIGTVDKFKITFDILIDGGTDTQADGLSMSISDDFDAVEAFGEEGPGAGGSKLIICFDNWDNGAAEGPAIDIKWGKEIVATVPMGTQDESTLDTEGWWPVEMELTPDGDLTISYNGELIHDAVNIPDFESIENARIAIGGRTGGANANQFIDNFKIVLEEGSGGPVETVPGLIAYWPFDGDLDDAVGDSHGTGQGGEEISYADGQFGQGIALDGVDQFVETPVENEEMFDFQDGTGFSISAWFTVDSFGKSWQALIAKGEGNRWRVHRRGGESVFTANGGSGDVSQGTTDVSDGAIHHIVLVSDPDGGEVRFYVDGEIEGTAGAPSIESNDFPMMIGDNPDARGRTWHGMIDDVGVWDRPITEDEIASIWNGGDGKALVTISAGGAIPKPRLAGMVSNAVGFSFQVKDVDGATVDPESIAVNFDGADVDVTKSKAEGVTAVSYESAELLAADSVHIVKVSVTDTNGNSTKLEKEFTVKPYTSIDTTVALPDSMKGESGFLVYATQISVGQMDVGELHGNQWVNAEKQINGGYIDVDTEEQYLNEADMDSFEGWSYYPEIVQVVNQNQDAPGAVGNFNADNGYEDEPITGIPGWGDSTDGIASEYIALLELERGAYKFGVNSDDGFNASFGANFGDLLAQTVGMFNGGRGASDTNFEIFVDKPGLYPYRVAWWEGGGGANIEIFSYVNGEKTLINDPDVEGSIKAYTIKGAVVDESTTVRATTGRAKVLSVSPTPGDTMVKSSEVVVTVQNEDTTVKQDTVVLSLNGEAVDANVSKSGDVVTISYSPDSLPVGAHTASLSFEESNGITRATEWSFEVPGLYARSGDVPAEPEGLISIREYHGVGGTSIAQLMGAANFPDSPDVSTLGTYFEWPASGDIEVPPAGNVRDNYGTHMMGYIYPPETGEYIFALACDDNGQLWLSTDESPANAKLIASQGGWQPVRDYRAETTSSEIFLEAGQVYFIEAFVNEGGGGDNLAVAWSLPEDGPSAPEPGALPISSDYLSPYSSVLDGPRTPILNSNGPSGAAIADTASISATFNNRGVAFTEVSVSVNGAVVDHTLATDGGTTTITANPGGAKGMVNVTLSWNGESKSWSYFGHDELGDGPNPIGFWDFNLDMGSGTTIDSVYGLVGELRNDAAFTDDAHDGMAMDFTAGGNQHVHVAAGEFLNIASSVNTVTVAFWQKNYSIPSTSSFWAEPGRAMQAHVPWSNGEIYWDTAGCCDGGTQRINANAADIGGWVDGDVETDEMLDTWHHYVFIKNEDAKEIWIDGELFHDGDNTNPLPTDINFLNIGGDQNGNNSLRGVIDDFAVFASALDEDQIIALAEGDRSILPAAPTHPIFVSASPDTATADGSAQLSVTLYKRADDATGAQLSVNGQDVATEVSTDGTTITITGTATGLASGTATANVSYNGVSKAWSISVPDRPVNNGDGTITFDNHVAWEWWDGIGGHLPEHLDNLINDARYPDSPDGATFASSWNTRTALAGGFDGNGRDNYGGRMSGILTAPESGTYRFYLASDDASVLRLSTDTDPANAVQVAHEDGCCKNFTLDDGGLSGTVDLVKGQQYYMEAILKEGGGGDWMTVGWRMPSEDIDSVPAGNQEGIPGMYFAGKVTVPALSALSSSVSVAEGNSMDPKATVTLNVTDGATTLDAASVVISLGGAALESTASEGTWSKQFSGVTQSGKTYSISAGTGAIEAGTEHTVSATFKDSAGETTTLETTFTIPVWELYTLGTKAPATAAGSISVRQYQGISGGFNDLVTSSKFPDSPDFEESVSYIEWPQTGDINTKPEGNVEDNYGVQMIGFLHPPATGDYQFAIASDDNSQLWLSTDESPSNRVLIAKETGWQPIRAYQAVGDEATSEFISLEAGKAYYIEILNKEGGGGDNVAVAWTTGDAIVPDALPISGDYLSPWVPVVEGPVDISAAGDAVVPSSDNHPAGEHAGFAIDNDSSTKYLNFDGANDSPSGLTITTGGGVVSGLGLTSANDAPDRDPATFVLSGSNDGGATFTEIASGDVPAFGARFERQEVSFANDVAYTTYELSFPTTAGASTCCMQIAEIELLGTAGGGGGGDGPALSVVNNGDGTVTITFEGTLQSAPTVNGPWENVDAPSPLTIPSDQAQQYGRAVTE